MAQRFKSSEIEKKVTQEYRALKAKHENDETQAQSSIFSSAAESEIYLDDCFALGLIKDLRGRGYDAFILPPPRELPFSYSREDILIWKR
jgi:hypothetical protein